MPRPVMRRRGRVRLHTAVVVPAPVAALRDARGKRGTRGDRSTYGFAAVDFRTTWFAFAQLASTKIWASLPFVSALSKWAV